MKSNTKLGKSFIPARKKGNENMLNIFEEIFLCWHPRKNFWLVFFTSRPATRETLHPHGSPHQHSKYSAWAHSVCRLIRAKRAPFCDVKRLLLRPVVASQKTFSVGAEKEFLNTPLP